jgi:hypothetical protein
MIIYIIYYYHKNIESFDTFSPYQGNQSYPFVYEKTIDDINLQKTLIKWEAPFNANDEGYYNAQPDGLPPLVPIYSYPTFNVR